MTPPSLNIIKIVPIRVDSTRWWVLAHARPNKFKQSVDFNMKLLCNVHECCIQTHAGVNRKVTGVIFLRYTVIT